MSEANSAVTAYLPPPNYMKSDFPHYYFGGNIWMVLKLTSANVYTLTSFLLGSFSVSVYCTSTVKSGGNNHSNLNLND